MLKTFDSIRSVTGFKIEKELEGLLELLERVNPCQQRYYLLDNTLLVSYVRRINLLSFKGRFNISLPIRIIGLPISLELSPVLGDGAMLMDILKGIKGFSLLLNLDSRIKGGSYTLPNYFFENVHVSFEDYLSSLRASYRRRVRIALGKGEGLIVRRIDNIDFGENHYKLYLEVLNRSEYPLECLPIEYFRESDYMIYEFCDKQGVTIGFVQLWHRVDKLIFMFCGFDNSYMKSYDIYYNMLLFIIKEGITLGVKEISFGQTSQETKLKLGCKFRTKHLYLHHNNKLIGLIIRWLTPKFGYKGDRSNYRVFKG